MEQGLQVDQDRIVGAGDQVLVVDVGGIQGVQQREQHALAEVEAFDLPRRGAGPLLDELHPPVPGPLQQRQGPQLPPPEAGVEPPRHLVEMPVRGERSRLVHHPGAGGEAQHRDAPPLPVAVAHPALHLDQRSRVAARQQPVDDQRPVAAEPAEQLGRRRAGPQRGLRQQPCEHDVFAEETGEPGAPRGLPDEVVESI